MQRNRVDDIRQEFKRLLTNGDYVIDKTGCKMLEIAGASFIADEDSIFGKVNYDYVSREISWYESMSLNVNDIPSPVPKIWKDVAASDGTINSNYGWCIWSEENHQQYKHVIGELLSNPFSRRATMIYTRPTMWYDYNVDGRSDFMCTNAVQYLIRDHKLHAIVQMRSNDSVFGYKNDRAWQQYVLDKLVKDLKRHIPDVVPGDVHWNVGSLHVYKRHFDLVK